MYNFPQKNICTHAHMHTHTDTKRVCVPLLSHSLSSQIYTPQTEKTLHSLACTADTVCVCDEFCSGDKSNHSWRKVALILTISFLIHVFLHFFSPHRLNRRFPFLLSITLYLNFFSSVSLSLPFCWPLLPPLLVFHFLSVHWRDVYEVRA